jgi:hypothetical protein
MKQVGHAIQEKFNLDANQTLFFARELESVESTLYEVKLKELKYRELIPVKSDDGEGSETLTYRMLTKVGASKIISATADDLPRVDIFGEEFTSKVRSIGNSYGFSDQEIRAAVFAGRPLDALKAESSRRATREKESDICWNGDAEHGLVGVLDNPNIPSIASPTGTGGIPWSVKTPDEIINDIRLMVTSIREGSKGINEADTLLLPIAQYNLISLTARSSLSDMTILEYVTKPGNSFGLTTITWLPDELKARFIGNTEDGALMYERDPSVLQQRIPMEIKTKPIQEKGLDNVVNTEARNGGVTIRYPLGLVIMTGI